MSRILCILTFTVCFNLYADAQTIADVARQERARREAIPKSRVVVTNESLKTVASDSNLAPGEKSSGEISKPAAISAGRDETYWRTRFKDARDNVKRTESQIAVLQLELNRANLALLQRSDIYNKEVRVGNEIADISARLEAGKADLQKTRQKLSDLEEEFRRSDAPAGWSR